MATQTSDECLRGLRRVGKADVLICVAASSRVLSLVDTFYIATCRFVLML